MSQVIAGDIGGTHCRLMLAQISGNQVEIKYEQTYLARDFNSFDPVLQRFLDESEASVDAACFAAAGPVKSNRTTLTNLPWTLDAIQLSTRFGIPSVQLINDFAANGYCLAVLRENDYLTLQSGVPEGMNRVLLGAGTGLGMALVSECQGRLQVRASEGGHMDFAPVDEEQSALLAFFRRNTESRISYEHILSGPGLVRLYHYFAWRNEASTAAVMASADPAAAVSEAALKGDDPSAANALALFFRIYGSCAANLALVGLAGAGVYLAGGIAAKLAPSLCDSDFMAAFNDKPPMRHLLEAMPVKVITNPRAGLLGAAWYAGNK